MHLTKWSFTVVAAWVAMAVPATASSESADPGLLDLNIAELMNIVITSASRKQQPLSESAAAVYVLDREKIRRSGLTSIPELLRLVPGIHVARIDANKWSISSRGFSGFNASKLLVMIDGRTVYTPLYSGVYWDVQGTVIDDIERIEVIRGPGGTLWGSNAVNGVINIITRSAGDTVGGLVRGHAGNFERGATLRYGVDLGDMGKLRGFIQAVDGDPSDDASGSTIHDAWDMQRGGFRWDLTASSRDTVTVSGDFYRGGSQQFSIQTELAPPFRNEIPETIDLQGGDIKVNWRRVLSDESDWELQFYYDRADRDELNLSQEISTVDLDFQHRFMLGNKHEVIWGGGYRGVNDRLRNSFTVSFDPEKRDVDLFSFFINDNIQLTDRLNVAVGTKVEHHDLTNREYEYQPSVRFNWQASADSSLWGAVSRAVEVPSRSLSDITLNTAAFAIPFDPDGPGPIPETSLPALVTLNGNRDLDSVELLAVEFGYRARVSARLSLDVALFHMEYDNLHSNERAEPVFETSPVPLLSFPINFARLPSGTSDGAELSFEWRATEQWAVSGSYSLFNIDIDLNGSSDVQQQRQDEGSYPEHQFQLHSYYRLEPNVELDIGLFYVGELEEIAVDSYSRLDIRLAWHARPGLELSLIGRNLFDNRHLEFATRGQVPERGHIPDSIHAQFVWQW